MDIFIGNIPTQATLIEFHAFVGDLELRADFHLNRGRDAKGEHYHYLVARTMDRQQGLHLIQRLRKQLFQGQQLVAREFILRGAPQTVEQERRVNAWG